MGAEAGETGCEWEEGSGLRSRLGAAGVSASILSDDLKEALGSIQEEEKTKKTKGKVLETNKLGEEKKKNHDMDCSIKSPPRTWKESQAVESSGWEGGLEVCVPSLKPAWDETTKCFECFTSTPGLDGAPKHYDVTTENKL